MVDRAMVYSGIPFIGYVLRDNWQLFHLRRVIEFNKTFHQWEGRMYGHIHEGKAKEWIS